MTSPLPFILFGPDHIAVLVTAVLLPLVLVHATGHDAERERRIRVGFAALLIANWLFWLIVFWQRGWLTLGDGLPLNLCDWANIAVIVALLTRGQRAFELGYFWAMAGTLQGLLTPDTPYGFPEVRFIIFSIFHGGLIAAVLYLIFGARMAPRPSSLVPVVLWTLFYAVVAGAFDWLFGTNYGFLRDKPDHPSLFDWMPPWPYYIAVLVVLGFISLAVYYAPFWIAARIKRKNRS